MIDQQMLNEIIIRRVQYLYDNLADTTFEDNITQQLHIPSLQKLKIKKKPLPLYILVSYCFILKKKNFYTLVILLKA